MRVITGEKIPIKMWLDDIEPNALRQARSIANLSGAFHHIAIMPDAHVGYGIPIGGVLATRDIIVPNAVGVDIGCGMVAVKTTLPEISRGKLKEILSELRRIIPTGFTHHKKPQEWEGFDKAPNVPIIQQELASARRQIGTLGGGNHFLEILQEADDKKWNIKGAKCIWLMLHSGSRNFGKKTADVYHKKARKFCEDNNIKLPDKDLAFLEFNSPLGQEYFKAMSYCLEFAQANRYLMMERFMEIVQSITDCEFVNFRREYGKSTGSFVADTPQDDTLCHFGIHHNFASLEEHFGETVIMHRKGATQAFKNQLGIVPGSMGTPSYIVEGLGNIESFMSSSHGAGRVMGRREANRILTEEKANQAIKGIVFGHWHGKFDEAPPVYKDIEKVIEAQQDLAKPIVKLKPLAVMIGN